MKSLKYILSILMGISLLGLLQKNWGASASASAAEEQVSTILAERQRAAKLPSSDTAILYQGTTFTLYADGRMDREEHILRYLRTDNSWDDYGDPHLAWDPARQELEVLVSRVYTVDGRKIDTTPNGFNPMVPFGLDLAPDFAHYRQMVVTHLGIETDAVIELKYVIRDKAPLYPWTWGDVLLGGVEPILERRIVINTPAGSHLSVNEEAGLSSLPRVQRLIAGDEGVYSWMIKDLPALHVNEAGARADQSLPRICFSTCPDWRNLAGEVNRRFNQALAQVGELRKSLAEYAEIGNSEQKLDSAIAFVQERLALKTYDAPGLLLNFRSVDRVFSTGYGGAADIALLQAAVLNSLGFKPEILLGGQSLLPVPGFSGREKYLIHLQEAQMNCWLDPLSGHLSFSTPEGMTLLGISPPREPLILPKLTQEKNSLRLNLELTFSADQSLKGWMVLQASGALSQYEKGRSQGAEDVANDWAAKLSAEVDVSQARFTSLTTDYAELRCDLEFAPLEEKLEGILRLQFPWDAAGIAGLAPANLQLNYPSRDLPLFLDHAGTLELEVKISFPEDWSLLSTTGKNSSEAAGITFQRSIAGEKGSLVFAEKVEFSQGMIPPGNWNSWRAVLLTATAKNSRTLLFKTEKAEQAQAEK